MKKKILIIGGPTASGKSSFAIEMAHLLNGEIISCDAMQIYKHLNIGTAKVTKEEMNGIPHYLLDFVELNQNFSVSDYKILAQQCIDEIISRGKLPIIVGGTGLYIDALLYPYEFGNDMFDRSVRDKYQELLKEYGKQYLYDLLKTKDVEWANSLHVNDVKRVIRALEIIELGGKRINKTERVSEYNFKFVCLTDEREKLYQRIDDRVDKMVQNGLIEEIKNLINIGADFNSQGMQSIGYKEWQRFFDGLETKEEAINKIKSNTRHYAKRQLTWFRHRENVTWFNISCDVKELIINRIKEWYYG